MEDSRKKYFATLRDTLQDQSVNRKKLKVTLQEIQMLLSFKGGLFNDEIKILAEFLCETNLVPAMNDEVIKCMIPKKHVSDDIVDMCLVSVLSKSKTLAHLKYSAVMLQWLLSILDFGFAELEPIQGYYHLFYSLLAYYELNPYACKMIYKLTKPGDVTAIAIKKVIKHYKNVENSARKIYMEALLKYFDSYKPNYIDPDYIRGEIHFDKIFQNLPQESSSLFAMLLGAPLTHCGALVPMIPVDGTTIVEKVNFQLYQSQTKKVNSLIPAVTYSYPLDGKLSILNFESIEQLGQKVVEVAIPDQILSLLSSKVGHFKLMTCDEINQSRFAHRLFETLKQIFWEKEDISSVEEKEDFLEQVISLCNLMQQGIGLCTTFVIGFLHTWSGLDYRSQIFHLIEWTVVDSYSELFPMLRFLHMLFVTSDTTMKCHIISTLTNLLGNMAKVFYRVQNKFTFPFMKMKTPTWTSDPVPMFQKTIRFIENLIQIGLCLEPNSIIFLDSAVSFHEGVSNFEEVCHLPLVTCIPKGVLYRCFLNRNINFLDRIIGLLFKYREHFQRLELAGLHYPFLPQKEICELYVKDILNTMWHGEPLTRRSDGIIFKMLPDDMLTNIKKLCPNNPNSLFEAYNHMTLVAAFKNINGKEHLPEELCKDQEQRYTIFKSYAKNIALLVDTVYLQNQYFN